MPTCDRTGCGNAAVAQWRRRPTPGEMATHTDEQEGIRAWALHDADPDLPPPVLAPMPTVADTTRAVFGCADHAIDVELASRVHAAECAAPHPDHLPVCDCEPEPHPEPAAEPQMVTLQTGWTVPALTLPERP
jgi:hypothetical protein